MGESSACAAGDAAPMAAAAIHAVATIFQSNIRNLPLMNVRKNVEIWVNKLLMPLVKRQNAAEPSRHFAHPWRRHERHCYHYGNDNKNRGSGHGAKQGCPDAGKEVGAA